MQWVILRVAPRALAAGMLLGCAITLAEEGPILPGLDELPATPVVSSPEPPKPRATGRIRRAATPNDQAPTEDGPRRGDDAHTTYPSKRPIRPNSLDNGGDKQPSRGPQQKTPAEPAGQYRGDVPRDRQAIGRGAGSKSQVPPEALRDQNPKVNRQFGATAPAGTKNDPRGVRTGDMESRAGRGEPGHDRIEPSQERPEVQREKARKSLPPARPASPPRNYQPPVPSKAASKTPPSGGLRFPPERR